MATAYTDQVQKVYIAYYGRAADPVGLKYWAAKVETDGLAGIMASFGASAEATTLYGSLTNTAMVNALYKQSFGRDADFTGLMYYAGQLTAGTMTAATIAQNIFDGASGSDATILTNKLAVAKAYTAAIDTAGEVVAYAGDVAAASARALLTTVDAATVTAGFDVATSVASIVSVASATPAVAGSTVALTTTTDNLAGGAGADSISAVIVADTGTGTTANAGDTISGGAGVDTMTLSVTGLSTVAITASAITTSGVEKLLVSNFDTNADDTEDHTIDTSLMTGLTTVGLSSSSATGDTHFTNLKNTVDAEMGNGSADLSVAYQATVVAGTTDTQNLTMSNQTAGSFTANSIETIAITSGTLKNTLTTLGGNAVTKLTMSGDKALTITDALPSTIKTIDGSGMTAASTLLSNSSTVSATLGSGGDTYKTSTAVAATYSIDGGAGTDTISVTAATVLDTALETARYTNFEALTINNTVAITTVSSQDMSLLSAIDTVTVIAQDITDSNADSTYTTALTNARAATTLNINSLSTAENGNAEDTIVAVSVASAVDGASDSVNLVLGTATASSGANSILTTFSAANGAGAGDVMLNVTASDAETITITSQGGANQIGDVNAADLTTLNVLGSKSLTMGALNANNTLLATVDASGMTGTAALVMGSNGSTTAGTYTGTANADTLVGGTKADTLTGGAGIDIITGGNGGDTVHGGDGDDSIFAGTGADTFNGDAGDDKFTFLTNNLTALDTIDGGAGTDTISMSNTSSIADSDFTLVTNVEKIVQTTSAHNMTVTLGALSNASGLTTVTDGTGTLNLTVGAGHTNALAVAISTGSDVVDGSASAAPLTASMLIGSVSSGDVLTGGSGNDTLSLTATGGAGIATGALVGITAFETFAFKTNLSTGSVALNDANIGAGKTLTIDGTAISGSNKVLTVVGTAETDGSLIVKGGAGDDAITGTASVLGDNLQGNSGNDTFTFATNNLTKLDVVDGGAGATDTLATSDGGTLVDLDFTGITNVEKLSLFAGTTVTLDKLAQAAGITTFVTSTGTNITTLKAGYTSDFTITLVTATDSVIGTAYTGSMNVKTPAGTLTSADTITGGTGTGDVLTITAGAALSSADLGAVTKVETFKMADDSAVQSITLADVNIASSESLTIDGSLMATSALTVIGTAETNGSLTVIGGGGADALTGTASSSGDTLSGHAGGDTFSFAPANLSALDTVSGGSGTDNITLTGSTAGTVTDADLTGVTGVETLNSNNGNLTLTLDAQASEAGIKTVNLVASGNTNSVTVGAGMENALKLTLTGNTDTISAASYTKALTVTTAEASLTSADTLTGGTGADTLSVTFSGTALSASDVSKVSKIETISSATNAIGGLTLGDVNIAKGGTLTVNAVKNTSTAFTLDAALELDGSIVYVGGAGVDTVTGGAKADTIGGGNGADVLTGNKGVDTITGGIGADQFVFTDANQSNTSGSDVLVDYLTGTDKIVITLNESNKTNTVTFDATINTAAAGVAAVQAGLSGSLGQATFDKTNNQLIVNANADNLITTLDYVINVPAVATAANSIVEGDVNYVITGGSAADFIVAGGGNDKITTTGGADTIDAGAGDDTITISTSVANALAIKGGTGNDTLVVLDAALGTIAAQNMIDLSTPANNLLTNRALTGLLTVENIDFSAAGSTKVTTLIGSATANKITGGAAIDIISGLGGIDTLIGGGGADVIRGGAGADIITGGAAADSYVIDNAEGGDIITDFVISDKIRFVVDDIANNGRADVFDLADKLVFANTDPTNTAGTVIALNASDYLEIAVGGTMVDAKLNILLTTAGFASVTAALVANENAGTAAGDNSTVILGFYNSSDAVAQLHYVSDTGTLGAGYTDAVSENLMSLTGLAASALGTLAVGNFELFSLG